MALTQEQWVNKLSGWVPAWFFERENKQVAYMRALALILSQLQEQVETEQQNTFIDQAVDEVLDLHGDERTTPRLTDELDIPYRTRIKNLANKSNRPDLKALVDDLLRVGVCTIVEDYEGYQFCARGCYLIPNGVVLFNEIYNAFTVFMDKQRADPLAFCERENFAAREDFMVSIEAPDVFFNVIVEVINQNKALGTLYRIIERLEVA